MGLRMRNIGCELELWRASQIDLHKKYWRVESSGMRLLSKEATLQKRKYECHTKIGMKQVITQSIPLCHAYP